LQCWQATESVADGAECEFIAIAVEIERFLRTGQTDPLYAAWSGEFLERARRAHAELRGALVREVRRRTEGLALLPMPQTDSAAVVRGKVEPMVRGLFPRGEQDAVLATLEKSVVVVTGANIESLLLRHGFDGSVWSLANLHLASLEAELLGSDAPRLVGLSEDSTCYVSPECFSVDEPFSDFIVHETAHIFHNCKRSAVGLRQTRTKERLLDIDFRKRETFAYSCEAYACVLSRAKSPGGRRELAEEYGGVARISDEPVDAVEVANIVAEAAIARNGWKVILARCAPTSRPRTALQQLRDSRAAANAARER
jgi:hypothetical protein